MLTRVIEGRGFNFNQSKDHKKEAAYQTNLKYKKMMSKSSKLIV